MAPLVIFVNDVAHARQQLETVLRPGASATPCTVVLCPPKLPHRVGKWLSREQQQHWRRHWADRLRKVLESGLPRDATAHVEWLTAGIDLVDTAARLRHRPGAGRTVVDARHAPFGSSLAALEPDRAAAGDRWKAPAAVTSTLSLVLALAD